MCVKRSLPRSRLLYVGITHSYVLLFEFAILPGTFFTHCQSHDSNLILAKFCGRWGKIWHLVAFLRTFRNTLKRGWVPWTSPNNNYDVQTFRISLAVIYSLVFLDCSCQHQRESANAWLNDGSNMSYWKHLVVSQHSGTFLERNSQLRYKEMTHKLTIFNKLRHVNFSNPQGVSLIIPQFSRFH